VKRVSHKAAYKCNWRVRQLEHEAKLVERCIETANALRPRRPIFIKVIFLSPHIVNLFSLPTGILSPFEGEFEAKVGAGGGGGMAELHLTFRKQGIY